jgi:hypothetical protein
VKYLEGIDLATPEFGDLYDELPLWSAPFGLMLLDRVPVKPGLTILDVGAGLGFSRSSSRTLRPRHAGHRGGSVEGRRDRLRRKIEQRHLDNIRLLVQDASALDLPDTSVDIIVSNLASTISITPMRFSASASGLPGPAQPFS